MLYGLERVCVIGNFAKCQSGTLSSLRKKMPRDKIRLQTQLTSPNSEGMKVVYAPDVIPARFEGCKKTSVRRFVMTVQAIPQGFHSLTAGLACKNAAQAIDLYKKAFGATEHSRMAGPDGRIMHAELQIGDSMLFLADEFPGMTAAPAPGGPPQPALYLYVKDGDGTNQQSAAAGCQEARRGQE